MREKEDTEERSTEVRETNKQAQATGWKDGGGGK